MNADETNGITTPSNITKELVIWEINSYHLGDLLSKKVELRQKITPAQETLLVYLQAHWKLALHWLVKLTCDPKHKIPANKPYRDLTKPRGVLLAAIYELCIQAHSCLGENPPYANADRWFFAIFAEIQLHGCHGIIHLQTKETPGLSRKNKSAKKSPKEIALEEQREVLQLLVDRKNPWENCKDGSWAPALSLLIEASLYLSKRRPLFEKKYWEPFIKANAAWLRDRDRNPEWGAARIRGGDLFVSTGQGRGVRKVPSQKLFSGSPTT